MVGLGSTRTLNLDRDGFNVIGDTPVVELPRRAVPRREAVPGAWIAVTSEAHWCDGLEPLRTDLSSLCVVQVGADDEVCARVADESAGLGRRRRWMPIDRVLKNQCRLRICRRRVNDEQVVVGCTSAGRCDSVLARQAGKVVGS